MRDASEREWAGIPSVTVCHKALHGGADAMRRLSGVPEYPFIAVDYPYAPMATWTPDEAKEVAKLIAPEVRKLLTKQQAQPPRP